MVRCYTSVTNNYIPKARLLAKTVKKFHPDWEFFLVNSEPLFEGFDLENEPFDKVLLLEDFYIDNLEGWLFKHRVVEICTAVKGPTAAKLLEMPDTEKVVYLDPDIAVFNSLSYLIELLDQYAIVLTPHQLTPESTREAVIDNEICSLKHGIYNLGFVALSKKEQGIAFANWWRDRLLNFCYDDIPNGLFTDQRWVDLAPAFFDDLHILRDPGYNVASWNLSNRQMSLNKDGQIVINNDYPLRFYHFTGYDSGAGTIMTEKYTDENSVVHDIWRWYGEALEVEGQEQLGRLKWKYSNFENGEKIEVPMRMLYRHRKDLQKYFPDPFATFGKGSGFLGWYLDKLQNNRL